MITWVRVMPVCACVVALHFGYFCFAFIQSYVHCRQKVNSTQLSIPLQVLNILFTLIAFAFASVCVQKWDCVQMANACPRTKCRCSQNESVPLQQKQQRAFSSSWCEELEHSFTHSVVLIKNGKEGQFPRQCGVCNENFS